MLTLSKIKEIVAKIYENEDPYFINYTHEESCEDAVADAIAECGGVDPNFKLFDALCKCFMEARFYVSARDVLSKTNMTELELICSNLDQYFDFDLPCDGDEANAIVADILDYFDDDTNIGIFNQLDKASERHDWEVEMTDEDLVFVRRGYKTLHVAG